MAQTHEYPVSVNWQGGYLGSGKGRAAHSGHEFPLAVPPEFKGSGQGTNPEELLTAAIAGCYSITFGIIAENRKLPVVKMETSAVGEVEQNGAQFTYKAIVLRPKITLAGDASDDQLTMAEDMAHKADAYCIVTNAVRGKVEIRVEPEVMRE
ncbi:MAG TPA: OsmC family protein [Fimbriimonadaceae bacterium]|nr:OsmC family protein [Fimbriimonadaceae bacterium]HRJ95736.1 OsmC family protein [Fimbriimonadaceae bacterium]